MGAVASWDNRMFKAGTCSTGRALGQHLPHAPPSRPRCPAEAVIAWETPSRADDVYRLGEHVEVAVPTVGPDHVQLASTDVRRVVVADEAGAGRRREGAVGDPSVRLEGRAAIDRDG